jgi:hypothetical protein
VVSLGHMRPSPVAAALALGALAVAGNVAPSLAIAAIRKTLRLQVMSSDEREQLETLLLALTSGEQLLAVAA